MKIVSLTEAKLLGVPRYFTGVPCKRGHVAERFSSDRSCVVCRAEQALARYHANPDQARASEKAWRTKNAAKKSAYYKRWLAANPDKAKAYSVRQRLSDVDGAATERTRKWRADNRDRVRFHSVFYQNKRRAAEMLRTPSWSDLDAIKVIYQDAAEFRAAGLEVDVDHIIPLQGKLVSGLHVPANLRICLSSNNRSKSNTFQI